MSRGGAGSSAPRALLPPQRFFGGSVGEDDERLALLDHVGRELGSVAANGVNGLRRDHQGFAGAIGAGLLAVDLVLERALDDIDDLLAWMPVPDGLRLRADLDAVLDHFAPCSAQIVVLKI